MVERDDMAFQAAMMYYLQSETMDGVARHLGVSRSTVSRLLSHAREAGLVRISLNEPSRPDALASQMKKAFKVHARVVPVREGATEINRLSQVSAVAAEMISQKVENGTIMGVAWGNTVAEIAQSLPPRELQRVLVVQLNGAANSSQTGLPYADAILSQFATAFRGRTVHFPVPALFDYASTREAMWRERSVQRVLTIQERVDLAVFGVGSLRSPVPSQVYAGGYLNEEDRRALDAEGVVADVCTVFLRADGSYRDISLNARASGPTPAQLSRIKTRVMVASSAAKAPAILAALRARVATDVVLDVAAAQAVLALAGRNRMGIGLGSHKPVES